MHLIGTSFVLLGSLLVLCQGFKPVIIIHGLRQAASSLKDIDGYIREAHPGTEVTVLDLYSRSESYEAAMMEQVKDFGAAIKKVSDAHPEGFHLIGFSQGGLIARGVLETVPNLNIDTFISLSSPQMGQFGDIASIRKYFPHFLKKELWRLLYNTRGQLLSFGGYWSDPMHVDSYRKTSKYLAYLNNETSDASHVADSIQWKNNFLRIQKLVLIGGPDDGTINPWQSAHFGYWRDCDKSLSVIVPMRDQEVYLSDSFGLKTLDQQGRIIITNHTMMHRDKNVVTSAVLPHLTRGRRCCPKPAGNFWLLPVHLNSHKHCSFILRRRGKRLDWGLNLIRDANFTL